jgi:putative N6-adenine-specific DNA methylase
MRVEHFFAPCPRGLEGILAGELDGLGAQALSPIVGGVGFTGPFRLCYQVNLASRIASRVLWRLSSAAYRTEDDVYQAARAIPWPTLFPSSCTIKVTVNARDCPFKSLNFAALRVKDAVCDCFRAAVGRRPTVETSRPDVRIEIYLDARQCLIYLDTSGEALFKRGLRQATVAAPLRENLAAGLLALSGWTPDVTFLDPMCGGGTLLLEAAQIAAGDSPGLGRRYTFELLSNFDRRLWTALQEDARARHRAAVPPVIHGSDREASAIHATRDNLTAAGLAGHVTLKQVDVLECSAPAEQGIIIMNPPYGVRLGEPDRLAAFYPRLGDMLKQRFAGWRAYVFTADLRLPKLIGLAPSRRIPLFNGALECRFYEFKLVRGPARHLRKSDA